MFLLPISIIEFRRKDKLTTLFQVAIHFKTKHRRISQNFRATVYMV